ncbi:MAG: DUF3068 domain-containing protein [Thermoplasmata archaeon]|nr:DUF3068 domain-containing protein [Thermoplasmata archaeon]
MKKGILVLAIIGVCVLLIAPIWAYIIVPPQLIMPEDVNESVTYTGEASMANPANLSQVAGPFDLKIERTYKGVDTVKGGDVLIIDESAVVTIDSPMTPPVTESFKLAVDRESYEHLNEDGDDWDWARYGRFTFGLHPEKKDIEFWLHDINDTVTAKYDGTHTYKGIDVIKYSMTETGPVTKNEVLVTQYAGMAYYYANSVLNGLNYNEDSWVYVDEVSGMIVYIERNIEFSGDVTNIATQETNNVMFSKMSYQFDEATSKDLIDEAKEADDNIQLYESTIPILLLVIGGGMLIVCAVLQVRRYKKAKTPQEELPAQT